MDRSASGTSTKEAPARTPADRGFSMSTAARVNVPCREGRPQSVYLSAEPDLRGPPNLPMPRRRIMTIPAPVCDCGTRKEPTAKRGILLCPHCDHGCKNVDGCTRCRKYTVAVSHRIQSAA